MTEPTQESLDEAAKAAGCENWRIAKAYTVKGQYARTSMIAHARTLDKLLGREPVDPVKALAKEMADEGFTGTLADFAETCLRKGMTLAPKAEPKPWTDAEVATVCGNAGRSYADFRSTFHAHLKERGE